ncbi:hypothetical protein LG293_17765 (plasmid) [Citricoccus nitrophenolicus]
MSLISTIASTAASARPSNPHRAAGNLLFLDFETTGLLDEPGFAPLELSVVVTSPSLKILAELGPLEISATEEQLESISDAVKAMHDKNRLLERVREQGRPLAEVESEVIAFAEEFFPAKGEKVDNASGAYLPGTAYRGMMGAGYSVGGFDRLIVQAMMPRLHRMMDHRVLDVAGLRHAAKAWAPGFDEAAAVKLPYTHSSLDDTRYAVALTKACVESLGTPIHG